MSDIERIAAVVAILAVMLALELMGRAHLENSDAG